LTIEKNFEYKFKIDRREKFMCVYISARQQTAESNAVMIEISCRY